MTEPRDDLERIDAYLEALAADPGAAPPAGLDAVDAAWVRALVRAHSVSVPNSALRDRIWRRALAAALAQRLDQHQNAQPVAPSTNGHHRDQEELMTVYTPTHTRTLERRRPEALRGAWTLAIAAGACALLLAGVVLLPRGGSTPPSGAPDNAGAGLIQDASPTPSPVDIRATPSPMEIAATPTFTASLVPTGTPIMVPQGVELVPTVPAFGGGAVSEQVISPWSPDLALKETLRLEATAIEDLVWSPGGYWLALADGNNIRLLRSDSLNGAPLLLEGHSAAVQALAFNPLSDLLASGDAEGTVHLWDTNSGASLQTLQVEGGAVTRLAFNPGGSALMVASEDGAVRVFTLP